MGSWFIHEWTLTCSYCPYGRIQVPVDLPASYRVTVNIKRTIGEQHFSLGLPVGDGYTVLYIDHLRQQNVGFYFVEGRPLLRKNGPLLPTNMSKKLVVDVTPNSILAMLDGVEIARWSGDNSVLTAPLKTLPDNRKWLFLGSFGNTGSEITKLAVQPKN